MLSTILNFLVYYIAYSYLLTALVNFFHPITAVVSFVILPLSLIFAAASAKLTPLSEFSTPGIKIKIDLIGTIAFLMIICWFIIVINRISCDNDTNTYHLPTALLMNHSIWYPGIGMLSLVMAFHNGTSILSSLFTSFNIPGLEFIQGFCIWVIFGIGIYLYLLKKQINSYISFIVASMFLLTPRIFWESYNMGTDMPMACFITFGLLALSDRNYSDAALFFALSAAFKPLGQAAFGLFMAGYAFFLLSTRNIKKLWDFKIILSVLLFALASLRLYIAAGNPLYPAIALKMSPWGFDIKDQQNNIIYNISNTRRLTLANYQCSLFGFLCLLRDFFIFPRRIWCSNWFSPFFLSCLFSSAYLFIKDKRYKNINIHSWLVVLLISIFIASWALKVIQVRFIIGILTFMALIFFCFSLKGNTPIIFKGLIYLSLLFTLVCFSVNVNRHFKEFITPMLWLSLEESQKHLPYKEDIFTTVTMEDGFTYTISETSYCGRSKPPCLHGYTVGNKDSIIREYKKYNKRFIKK